MLSFDSIAYGLADLYRISFKRKQREQPRISLPAFLQPLPGRPQADSTSAHRSRHVRGQQGDEEVDITLDQTNGHAAGDYENKDGVALDWQGDGPRQRVGYDDLTAIDWIFEYTKERQRLRMLRSRASGWLGQMNQLWDASQIWLVLVATGVASGILASSINIVSNWLEDLKGGFCRHGRGGGKFYLNRSFCCWGLDGIYVHPC
jgi:chloride channel 3/4/5